jgi:3-isopropylmalate/(R)-2-methylmalate dehydratase small subunit
MQAFTTVTGVATPFPLRNCDTDVIIPARYLKRASRKGMGEGTFYTVRFKADGSENPDAVFNQPRYRHASILLAGDNFGCGSSREHAAWGLVDLGYRCVIAPSFADIFASNAFKNGILTVVLPQEQVDMLMAFAPDMEITIDLENQVVTTPRQDRFSFDVDPFKKHCLINGLDEIGLTLQADARIAGYESRLKMERPWVG